MNLFLARPDGLTPANLSLGQGSADIATIGLLQERAIREKQVLAEQLQGALTSRVLIEQAKGILAERHDIPMDRAFTAMRTHARNYGRPLHQVANQIIDGTFDNSALLQA